MTCPRHGVRHALAVVLALTACAVLSGATSLLAVGEWIADAPAHVLDRLGVRPDPLLPRWALPSETTVRRLLARIDGDALDQAVGCWLADRRPQASELRGLAVDGKSLRGAAKPKGRKIHLLCRAGAHQRRRPGPAGRRREDQRGHALPAAAGHGHRPCRGRGHRRRSTPNAPPPNTSSASNTPTTS
ncbi:MAG: transposase family protein [Pseudonocardiaceae bacterium]